MIENLVKVKNSQTTNKEDVLLEEYKKQSEDIRLLAYKFLVDNLNKKYDSLNSDQKSILREYINNISNTNSISTFVIKEREKLRSDLTAVCEKVDSKITQIKIMEVVNQLSSLNVQRGVKDGHVMLLLMSHELLKEVNNVLRQ